ncbi:MAG: peroxiredoxin [Acidimicrobiales bacterium]
MAPPKLGAGAPAPDFTLAGTGDRDYTLSEYRGNPVVLVFYPGDNTPVCTMQLNSYTSDIDRFNEVGAQVLGISPQDVESHDRFSDVHGFQFPLLADTEKQVARAYGVLGPVGFYRRSVFVIDAAGVVRYAHRATAGLTFRPVDELIAAVEAANTPLS